MKQATLLLLLSTFLFSGCRKDQDMTPEKNETKAKVINWLSAEQEKATVKQAARIKSLSENLDYSKLYTEEHYDGQRFIIIPVKQEFKPVNNRNKDPLINLLLTLDGTGKITYGRIMHFIPETGAKPVKLPLNTFHDMCNGGEVKVNGTFRATSVGDRYIYEVSYKDGRMTQSKLMNKKQAGNSLRAGQNCIDWYIVTTIYLDGIAVSQNYEYIGQTCYGCNTFDESLDPLDCGTTGSGGSGGGNGNESPENMPPEPVSKQVSWVVKSDAIAGWNVKSYEQLNGMKPASPDIPYFTSITHQNDGIYNIVQPTSGFYSTWQRLAVTTSITAGGGAASSTVAGKVTNTLQGDKEISNVNTWLAANEF